MKFVNRRSGRGRETHFITLPRSNTPNKKKAYTFEIGNLKVNLKDGTFTLDPREKDVVQNTALAFVTATLYLLVQPRPKDDKSSSTIGNKKVCVISVFYNLCHS